MFFNIFSTYKVTEEQIKKKLFEFDFISKMFYCKVVTFVLWVTITYSDVNDAHQYNDSFDVLQSHAMTHLKIFETINDAEQARIQHSTDFTKISEYMRVKFAARYRNDANCFTNIGPISGGFWANPYFIYLKSVTGDNMHIVCFKSPFSVCNADQIYFLI